MSIDNHFDKFIDRMDESQYTINKEMKDKILSMTYRKIGMEIQTKMEVLPEKKNGIRIFSVRNIAAACLAILLVSALIPNSPVNALCQKMFSFIPGVGVIRNEGEEEMIKGVLNEPVRVADQDEFLEVRSAYITNNTLNVAIITNIGTGRIENIQDKEEVLKYFSGETMPGIYLQVNGRKMKLTNYSSGSPSLETKAYKIAGYFYLDKDIPVDSLFRISMEGFSKAADIKLSPVRNGVIPESMGSTITANNIMIFADTSRSRGILSVDFSTVAPKTYDGVRFNLFDHEKTLLSDSVYIIDKQGVKYRPDEDLRRQNNGGINTFYFKISDDKEVEKIVLPQILYSRKDDSEIKIKMPKIGKEVSIDKEIDIGGSLLRIEKASLVPKGDSLLPGDFADYDCLKIVYSTRYKNETNERILRMIPDIQVPDTVTGYKTPSSGIYSELCPLDKNEGYALAEFEDMCETKNIMINIKTEQVIIGPFEMDISN